MNSLFLLSTMILVGVGILVVQQNKHTVRHNPSWPTVEGQVHVYKINTRKDLVGEEQYEPRLVCEYKLDDIPYSFIVDDPIFRKCNQREWENVARYYPSKYTVTVQYDPVNPQRAYIKSPKNNNHG